MSTEQRLRQLEQRQAAIAAALSFTLSIIKILIEDSRLHTVLAKIDLQINQLEIIKRLAARNSN